MRVRHHFVALTGILPLAACAVLGPVADSGMEDAPYQACGYIVDSMAPADTLECLTVQVRPAGGQWGPFAGPLSAGDELVAIPSAAPQCAHGNYTHFVLEGASDAGALRIAVPDGFGRGDRGRSFTWHEPRSRWTADNIGSAVHIPAAARVTVSAGEVRLTSVCFKSYTHYRIPGERRRHLL